jgi:uncharacterized membrane protein
MIGHARLQAIMSQPIVSPEPSPSPQPQTPRVNMLRLGDPLRWLRAGVSDAWAFPGIAMFYGVCFWCMTGVVGAIFRHKPEYTMSFASGCLLLGPFLAMGLYDVSRRREQGSQPRLSLSITCWDRHLGSMGLLVLVLIVLELLWGRASLVVFAVFFNTGMPDSVGVFRALLSPENWEFLAVYAVVGGIFAALVFSTTVVSIPMILDRDTDAVTAAITSIAVVLGNLLVMIVWGLIITLLVVAALFTPWAVAIAVIGPCLGHASWYAYRSSVRWEDRITVD